MDGIPQGRLAMNGDRVPARISTVLFDLDDTLLESFAARIEALHSVFSAAGIRSQTAEEFLRSLRGGQFEHALNQLEAREGRDLDLFGSYRRAYWGKGQGLIRLYPGIKSVLQELHAMGTVLGVVTQKGWTFELDGRPAGAVTELMEMGVIDLFSVGVGFESVTRYKPHPEGILLALNQLGASAEETIMVGDSPADIEAGRAAGCWSCHATWGIPATEHNLAVIKADLVIETPEALLTLSLS